jgi:DNA polymerase III delta prime subunit
MPTFPADPSNFADLLQIVRDGHEIALTPGDYKGPFTIDKSIRISGTGTNTLIWAVDEPALVVKVPGVRLENLAIERTVGGDTGAVVLSAGGGTSPILNQVKLRGVAENVQWEGASWDIPAVLDFGEIETNRQVERSWPVQVGAPCEVLWDLPWLQVKNSQLYPGLQNLEVVLNSRDVPAGTNLAGAIFLGATDGIREIAVAGKIKNTSPPTSEAIKDAFTTGEDGLGGLGCEDWGYRFVGDKVIDNLIRESDGKVALERYAEFSDRRNRAEEIMSEILEDEPALFYVRRKGQGQDPGEEKWELTIATDLDDVELPALLEERGKSLSLIAVVSSDGYRGLRLLSARLVPQDRGQTDGFAVISRIRLISSHQYGIGVPRSALTRMEKMPVCGEHVPTEEQLQVWKAFLNIEERIAKTRQFFVPFSGHNYGSATRRITFEVNPRLARADKSSEEFIKLEDFWNRAVKARNEDVKLFQPPSEDRGEEKENGTGNKPVKRSAENEMLAVLLGSIEEVNREKGFIKVRLESDLVEKMAAGHYQLPKNGFLSFEAVGDITQIKRKKRALDDLQKGNTQNPYLGEFFFNASQARPAQRAVKLKPEDLLLPTANPDQIAAVEAVLSAPDLALIQGPPGTGKTTVIAEICYQVALRGGRTLIASQANLAVDNALSRLIHSPVIRALRKGRAESVEEEGLPFLEEKVIGTWLQNTAEDCEKRLAKRWEKVELLWQFLEPAARFAAYIRAEEALQGSLKELQKKKGNLQELYRAQENKRAEAEAKVRQIDSVISGLDSLLASAPAVNWENPAVIKLLESLSKHMLLESSVRDFQANVQTAVKLARELGIAPPNRELFGLAVWLRDNVPNRISEARNDLVKIEASHKEQSKTVAQLQRSYQRGVDQGVPDANLRKQMADAQKQLQIYRDEYGIRLYRISQLNKLMESLDPFSVLRESKNNLMSRLQQEAETAKGQLEQSQTQLREIEAQLQQPELPEALIAERKWWESAFDAMPAHIKQAVPPTCLFELDFLRTFKAQFDDWERELDEEEDYLSQYENFIRDWIARLRNPSAQDKSDLRRIYIDSANVIGITCSQAASRDFATDFNNFDVIIIDEVSKCTPPELLIPALKGKKLVLIGDYRQLPPMLHEHSLEEIAEEIGSAPEDISFLEESLFKTQFEAADESLKCQLSIQYRMHPYIMGAINQFYEERLECGILEPDKQRAHNLAGSTIQENHHLIWVKMPVEQGFEEQREGTSFFNTREIDAIDAMCQEMEDVWSPKVAEGKPRKEIGIITFYGAQLRRIEEMLSDRSFPSLQIRTGTVDRFQGMERPVVIVSMVRNNGNKSVGFAKKPERVNVAFSRAQELLVIVGCHSLFTQHAGETGRRYSKVSDAVRRNQGLIDVSRILS